MSAGVFGERLRALVIARYPSLRAFANAIKMEPTYLSRIVNGHVQLPERETLRRMADALDMTPAEFEEVTGVAMRESDGDPAGSDRLELLFEAMRRRPEVRRAVERGSEGLEGEELAEYLELTADAWYANLHMQERTRRQELERAGRGPV